MNDEACHALTLIQKSIWELLLSMCRLKKWIFYLLSICCHYYFLFNYKNAEQKILTKDSVTVSVDAVVYFRIFNAVISVINVEDAAKSTKLLAASTLRNILGTKSLHEILSDRESVAILIQVKFNIWISVDLGSLYLLQTLDKFGWCYRTMVTIF